MADNYQQAHVYRPADVISWSTGTERPMITIRP